VKFLAAKCLPRRGQNVEEKEEKYEGKGRDCEEIKRERGSDSDDREDETDRDVRTMMKRRDRGRESKRK